MTEIAKEQPVLTVYYWSMMGRAGATVRMLEHTGQTASYILKSLLRRDNSSCHLESKPRRNPNPP